MAFLVPQVQEQARPNVRVPTDAPLSAFGGGESLTQVTDAVQGLTTKISDIAKEEKQKADTVAFVDADRQASEAETKIQIEASKMLGKDAAGATQYAKDNFTKSVEEIKKGLQNDTQRNAFDRAASQRWESLNKAVETHSAKELQAYATDVMKGHIDASKQAAMLNANDDRRIAMEVEKQKAVFSDLAKQQGIDPADTELYKSQEQAVISPTHAGVIQSRLTAGQDVAAKAYFKTHKNEMTAADIESSQRAIENGSVITEGNSAWSKVSGFKLADGNLDEAKMEAAIMGDSKLDPNMRQKVWEFVKAKGGEAKTQKTQQDNATNHQFLNDVISVRKQGGDLEAAMRIVPHFGGDEITQAERVAAVQKIYSPPTEDNPEIHQMLWEKIQAGNATQADIDAQKNNLSAKSWMGLRQDLYKFNTEGKNPENSFAWDRVKDLAKTQFGSDKDSYDQFMYVMHTAASGMSADQIIKTAKDKLEKDPGTGFFFDDKKYQTDLKRSDVNSLVMGKLYEDVGKEQTTAIGRGVLYSGQKEWGASSVQSFADQLGGYSAIKKGTPANNAIQSLINKNQIVSPANVKWVIENHPNGVWK